MTWLVNPYRFGAPPGHHYGWRVVGLNTDAQELVYPEIIFAATPGGADIAGGTPTASHSGVPDRLAAWASDGDLATRYEHGGTNSLLRAGSWWGKVYSGPVSPVEVRIGTDATWPTYTVRSVLVQRGDYVGGVLVWTSVAMGLLPSAAAGVWRTFSFDPTAVMPTNEIRAWGVTGTASQLGEYNVAALEFAASAGGTNLALQANGCQAGTGDRPFIQGTTFRPSWGMIDGNNSTGVYQNRHTANNWPDGTLAVYFPSHTDAVECRMRATTDYPTGMFSTFTIWKSHDGFTKQVVRTVTGNTGVTAGQLKTWSIP